MPKDAIVSSEDLILVTGASGFIGTRVVARLLERGFQRIRCFVKPTSDRSSLEKAVLHFGEAERVEIINGNLLSRADCQSVAENVALVYHLAAGTRTKAFSDAYLNSVVTTRNLMDAILGVKGFRRFVNVSSFACYTNRHKRTGRLLDETCPLEENPGTRAEAYLFGKVKQDRIVLDYAQRYGLPYIILRPGVVYGPEKRTITGRVGIDTFGIFLHLGGGNPIPFTFADNCADAIVLAGLKPGIEGEVFNIVDDDLPSSRTFLRSFKRGVRQFPSIYVPHAISYLFCYIWERYAARSHNQLPPVFSRREWSAFWKKTLYSNEKIKAHTGWNPQVPTREAMKRFFEGCTKEAVVPNGSDLQDQS